VYGIFSSTLPLVTNNFLELNFWQFTYFYNCFQIYLFHKNEAEYGKLIAQSNSGVAIKKILLFIR